MAQLDLQQPANAAATFEKLVKAEPKLARAHYLLAKTYAELGKVDDVRVQLEKALAIDPDLFVAKLAMARLLMEENKPEEAMRMQKELAEAYPDNVQVTALEGWLALRQGRPKEAADAFRRTLKKQPSNEVTVYLATSLLQQGDSEAAIITLKNWVANHPTDLAVQFNLANSYLLLNRQNEARSAFARVIELAPDHTLALNNLAWLLRKEDPVKALKYAEHAYDLTPNSPIVLETYGALLLDQGETQRAVRYLQQASRAMPENLNTRYQLALALVQNGDKAEARELLNQILGSDQEFKYRKEAEALLQSLKG
jgi:putative PEP-CTERM system TPR-repeat lipoprotein